jgi:hypothetical protein
MKKKIVIIVVVLLLLSVVAADAVCRILQASKPLPNDVCFLPSEDPFRVTVGYFKDNGATWQQVKMKDSDAAAAISLLRDLEGKPRYHSNSTVDLGGGLFADLYMYHAYIEGGGGTVQFHFDEPITYDHSEFCVCKIYAFAKATYNHIDVMYYADGRLLVNFLLDEKVIAAYDFYGNYLPSFKELLRTYNPAFFAASP